MTKERFQKIQHKLAEGTIVYIDKCGTETGRGVSYSIKSRRQGTKCVISERNFDWVVVKRVSDGEDLGDFWIDNDYVFSDHFCNCFSLPERPRYFNV